MCVYVFIVALFYGSVKPVFVVGNTSNWQGTDTIFVFVSVFVLVYEWERVSACVKG